MARQGETLFDFSDRRTVGGWRSVDDVVMGGTSESRLVAHTDTTACFEGHVLLERGSGFASVRAPEQTRDLTAFDGLSVRARGDGKRYQLVLYVSSNDIAGYRYSFVAAGTWTDYFAPFDALKPARRGSVIPGAPPFDPSRLSMLGFLITEKQEGPFRLELRWIRAVSQP